MQESDGIIGSLEWKKEKKSPIQNWSELRACMKRTFIPPSFNLDHEIEKKKI